MLSVYLARYIDSKMLYWKHIKSNELLRCHLIIKILMIGLTSVYTQISSAAEEKAVDPEAAQEEQHLQLAPIRTKSRLSGDLNYTFFRQNTLTAQFTQQSLSLGIFYNFDINTFILQPWIAQISSNLRAGLINSKTKSSSQGQIGQASTMVSGDVVLNVLKQSRFPFSARIFRGKQDNSGSYSSLINTSQDGYVLTQEYRTWNKSINSFFEYVHSAENNSINPSSYRNSFASAATLTISPWQSIHWQGNNTREYQNSIKDNSLSLNSLQHIYQPNNVFSIGSMLNTLSNSSTVYQANSQNLHSGADALQFSSLASWRPERSPLTATTSVRLIKQDSHSTTLPSISYKASNFNLGANYLFSPFIRMYGSVNVSDAGGTQSTATNLALAASKHATLKRAIKVDDWRYTTFIGGSLSTSQITSNSPTQNTTKSTQGIGVNIGHALDKNSKTESGILTSNLNQSLSTSARNTGALTTRLSTGGSWTLSEHIGSAISTFYRLGISDSRQLSGSRDFFQMINLQAEREQSLGRHQNLRGNITGQVTRYGNDSSPTIRTPLSPIASLAYLNLRTFGIRNLKFDSILTAYTTSSSVLTQFNASEGQTAVSTSWENNFNYHIGLTTLSLLSKLTRIAGRNQSTIFFNLHRQF